MNQNLILSISSSDYQVERGGINKVIFSHQKMMNRKGFDYIYIYPMPKSSIIKSMYWHIIENGKKKREIFDTEMLKEFLYGYQSSINSIFLHHLMRIIIDELEQLLCAFPGIPIYYYIHDYYTICNQYNLLKNGDVYCGGNRGSKHCNDCRFYAKDYPSDQIRSLFCNNENIIAIAPSEIAKNIWLKTFDFMKNRTIVIYHQRMVGNYAGNLNQITDRKLNIAYVGSRAHQKGWDDWNSIIKALPYEVKTKYTFWAFGNPKGKTNGMRFVRVNSTNNPNAMMNALRNNSIDVVFLGSIWPETYAYTFYEAYASNAFILANINSGNIANQVEKTKNGIVFKNINEIVELIAGSDFLERVNAYKSCGITGPSELMENDEIIGIIMTNNHKERKICHKETQKHPKLFIRAISFIDRTSIGRKILLRLEG